MAPSTSSTAKGENLKALTNKFLQLRSDAYDQGMTPAQLHQALLKKNDNKNGSSSHMAKKEEEENGVGKRATETSTAPTNNTTTTINKYLEQLKTSLRAHKLHLLMAALAVAVAGTVLTFRAYHEDIVQTPCVVDINIFQEEITRPRVDCAMCRDIRHVPEERNLSSEDFYRKYAFTGRPVLVKEATVNWTAMSQFSFTFFRDLYRRTKGALTTIEEDCQFFPYETEFFTLRDALSMPEERAAFQPGQRPWYIGWSNCHEGVMKKLRKHYERPYFLPKDSETVAEDWIFMGGPGPGALIHLDYVMRPSWQAQISGTKTWHLVPSPECEAECHAFNVTVHKGDIIVVDTNIWYHSTVVQPGDISITIGSEYD